MQAVGADVGFSHTKVWASGSRVAFPSVVGTPIIERSYSLMPTSGLSIKSQSEEYIPVGQTAIDLSLQSHGRRDPSWVVDSEWMTLLLAGLSEVITESHKEIVLFTGLPAGDWFKWQGRVKDSLRGKTLTFQRQGRDEQSVVIKQIGVATQPYGSLADMALNNQGVLLSNMWSEGFVGIADIGGNHFNFLTVQQLHTPVDKVTGSDKRGLLHELDNVVNILQDEFDFYEPSTHEVAEAIGRGTFRYQGNDIDIWPYAEECMQRAAVAIFNRMNEAWSESGRLDAVLLTGGGSVTIGRQLKELMNGRYANVHLMEDARWGNVRGYRKLAERMRKRLGG